MCAIFTETTCLFGLSHGVFGWHVTKAVIVRGCNLRKEEQEEAS